jgi:hypothetical protein
VASQNIIADVSEQGADRGNSQERKEEMLFHDMHRLWVGKRQMERRSECRTEQNLGWIKKNYGFNPVPSILRIRKRLKSETDIVVLMDLEL